MRPQLHPRPLPYPRDLSRAHLCQDIADIDELHVAASTGLTHHRDRLRQVGRAGGIEHHAAGPDQPQRRVEKLALEPHQCGYVSRLFAPPGFRTTTKSPESGTRGIKQYPVESRLEARIAPIGGVHGDRKVPGRVADQLGAMLGHLDRGERGPLDLREPRASRPYRRAGTQVNHLPPSSPVSGAPAAASATS